MEDVVEAGAWWKVEAVGDVIDDLDDVVWPIEARLEHPL